jgi:hypothetical protein
VRLWCKDWNQQQGALVPLEKGWRLAQGWYGADRRAPEWKRPSLEEAESAFANAGLTGPFWALR